MAEKYNEVANRLMSTRSAAGNPSIDHIVTGADAVYDDTAPYRNSGHIECNEVTPTGTENPQELEWYEKVYDTLDPTLFEWIPTADTAVDSTKTYGIPIGAKQSAINKQMYSMLSDISGVTINADDANKVITSDSSKIINKDDGYVPTAAAIGNALGANFEDNLQSTSTVKGLTANMGRVLNENKANINGYYETMSVGSAKNLDGETINSEDYLIRPTGGENNEVVSGLASVVGIEGNSCVWNQLIINGGFENTNYWRTGSAGVTFDGVSDNIATYTIEMTNYAGLGLKQSNVINIVNKHKYGMLLEIFVDSVDFPTAANGVRLNFTPTSGDSFNTSYYNIINGRWNNALIILESTTTDTAIVSFSLRYGTSAKVSSGDKVYVRNIKMFDFTDMGIDNLTTVAEVEEWLAQHVGTKPYYAYKHGNILSANTIGFKTYSRNLLNPSNGLAKLIPYTHTTNSNKYTIKGIPTGVAVTYTTDNTGVAVDVTSAITDNTFDISSYGSGTLSIPNATANTYVCMKYDDTMDDEVVPYKDNTYNFDVTKVYGKIGGSDKYVQCYPNGMRSAGTVHDTLTASEAVVNTFVIHLGADLGWSIDESATGEFKTNPIYGLPIISSNNKVPNIICPKYYDVQARSGRTDMSLTRRITPSPNISIKDTSISTTTELINKCNGLYIISELATPITYTDLIYRDGGIDRPLADVLMNITVNNWSMEEQLMTPYDEDGNPTSVPAIIQTKYSIDAVEAIKTLEEKSYFESDIHDNLQAMLTCINTNCASVLGGQFSISENATNKLFNFTFTANASANSTEENTETI